MHNPRSHGGYATQAARRGEQYEMCNTCGQRRHSVLPDLPHDVDVEEESGPMRIAGMVLLCLVMFLAVMYAAPIVLHGLAGQ